MRGKSQVASGRSVGRHAEMTPKEVSSEVQMTVLFIAPICLKRQ